MKLLVATRSTHKLDEIRAILSVVPGLELVSLEEARIPEDPAVEDALEPHDTFEQNAESKAAHFRRVSGLPTVADDSGLEVDVLAGRPGVRSRRFAPVPEGTSRADQDRANNEYLLDQLPLVEDPRCRTARYVCVAALDEGKGSVVTFRGSAEGRILSAPRGSGGFGYDPLFLFPELDQTFAEISPAEKDARSHRGKAFRALAAHLLERAGTPPDPGAR
jgi:XTP/dITP diphosphohydrolase